MKELIQVVSAFFVGIGFSLISGLHGKQLPLAGFGSALTWICYLITDYFGISMPFCVFLAAMTGSICSVLLARFLKIPKTVFFSSILLPLIPGSDLYYTVRHLIVGDFEMFFSYGIRTLSITFAISIGVIVILISEKAWTKGVHSS